MLRRPGSLYERKRSWDCLKVKKFFDAECQVVALKPGTGKHQGRMGALSCRVVVGGVEVTFDVGSGFTDAEREAAEQLYRPGTTITFGYFEFDKKTLRPRFPTFIRVRNEE